MTWHVHGFNCWRPLWQQPMRPRGSWGLDGNVPGTVLSYGPGCSGLPPIGHGGDLVQVAPFLYPVLVVVAPGWAYEGWLNWSTEIDLVLQAVGLGL